MRKRRILVLSSSTGNGHDARAKAFARWVEQLFPDEYEVRTEQVIENGSLLGRFGVWIYNTIQRHWPRLHHVYFFIVEVLVGTHAGKVTFGGRAYRKCLLNFRPEIVFSVHDSTNRGYFEDAKRLLGPTTRCVTYCGEYSGGYGYSRNWVNPVADLFIARTKTAAEYAIALGMDPQRTQVFHKFLPPRDFARERISSEQRAELLRSLGLDPERLTVFLATGGFGANHHRQFLQAALSLSEQVQFLVVCGRNSKVLQQLRGWLGAQPQLRCHLEGYCTRMGEFMQIADAIVTRGGANTTTEAIHFGCPILFNALGGLMPQEHCTTRYLTKRGAALMLSKPDDLRVILRAWLERPDELQRLRAGVQSIAHDDEHPAQIIAEICGLSAESAAGS